MDKIKRYLYLANQALPPFCGKLISIAHEKDRMVITFQGFGELCEVYTLPGERIQIIADFESIVTK